jgi:hypothetical protein
MAISNRAEFVMAGQKPSKTGANALLSSAIRVFLSGAV